MRNLPIPINRRQDEALRRVIQAGHLMAAMLDLTLDGKEVALRYGLDNWEAAIAAWRNGGATQAARPTEKAGLPC